LFYLTLAIFYLFNLSLPQIPQKLMMDIYRVEKAVADSQAIFNKLEAKGETSLIKAKTLRIAKEILLIAQTLSCPLSVMYSAYSDPTMLQKIHAELANVERENEM